MCALSNILRNKESAIVLEHANFKRCPILTLEHGMYSNVIPYLIAANNASTSLRGLVPPKVVNAIGVPKGQNDHVRRLCCQTLTTPLIGKQYSKA